MFSIFYVMEALLIAAALSIDAFVSSLAYGANKIRIPFSSVVVINVVCNAILGVALLLGNLLQPFLQPQFTMAICFVLLLGLGVSKVFDSAVKAFIRHHKGFQRKIQFSAWNLGFILNVYADPQEADRDGSRILSPAEAAYLAVALSLDGLAAGFGAGITNSNPLLVVGFSMIATMSSVLLGCWLGTKLTEKLSLDLTWLSGVLLVFLAISKLA